MTHISIIIPTYNEADILASCLESLSKQTFKDFEVIVVDDGSTDKTSEVLRNFQFTISNLQFLEQNHGGAGKARNLGAKKAKGKILVFVDADMTFDESFLDNLVKPILKGNVRGTFSKDEYVENWENIWSRCWNINEGWQEKRRHPKNYPDHQPVFRAILKSEFDRVGGYTPGGYDDDWSLGKKLGYDATSNTQFFTPKAIFYHKNPESLPEIYKHAKWIGKRKYKLGFIGYLIALVRVTLPISILIGIYKSFVNHNLQFMIFKIVYDFGIFIGILEYIFLRKESK